MMKRKVVETPELKIVKANLHVEAQQSQFQVMVDEVNVALTERSKALSEVEKEIASLEGLIKTKRSVLEAGKAQNKADIAFIERLNEMMGK
jgi:hypothetical protein